MSVAFTAEYLKYLIVKPSKLTSSGLIKKNDSASDSALPYMHVVESPRWNLATDEGRLAGAAGVLSLRMYYEQHGRLG